MGLNYLGGHGWFPHCTVDELIGIADIWMDRALWARFILLGGCTSQYYRCIVSVIWNSYGISEFSRNGCWLIDLRHWSGVVKIRTVQYGRIPYGQLKIWPILQMLLAGDNRASS